MQEMMAMSMNMNIMSDVKILDKTNDLMYYEPYLLIYEVDYQGKLLLLI